VVGPAGRSPFSTTRPDFLGRRPGLCRSSSHHHAREPIGSGGTRRGTGRRARCSPLDIIESRNSFRTEQASAHEDRKRQAQVIAPLTSRRQRAAFCAARPVAPLLERLPTAVPWRERPPEMAALPAKPAAREAVAHATLKDVSTLVAGGSSTVGIASVSTGLRSQIHDAILPRSGHDPALTSHISSRQNSPWILRELAALTTMVSVEEHRPSRDHDRAVLGVVKALAALDPAGYGLDGASAQLEVAPMRWPTKLVLISALTRRVRSRIVKFSSVPSRTPPQSRQTRSAASERSQSKAISAFNNQSI
jgi:hypothetical protein